MKKDKRMWVKVFPRSFNNEFYFVGFLSKGMKNRFLDFINDFPFSNADDCLKKEVEKVEEFEEINSLKIFTRYGGDTGIIEEFAKW